MSSARLGGRHTNLPVSMSDTLETTSASAASISFRRRKAGRSGFGGKPSPRAGPRNQQDCGRWHRSPLWRRSISPGEMRESWISTAMTSTPSGLVTKQSALQEPSGARTSVSATKPASRAARQAAALSRSCSGLSAAHEQRVSPSRALWAKKRVPLCDTLAVAARPQQGMAKSPALEAERATAQAASSRSQALMLRPEGRIARWGIAQGKPHALSYPDEFLMRLGAPYRPDVGPHAAWINLLTLLSRQDCGRI